MSRITEGRLALSTGVGLAYAESGDRNGPALVLIHGYTDSHRSLAPLMAALPDAWRKLAITVRGHGDSDKPAGPYDIDAFVADLAAALDALGVGRAAILGHSMGSLIAQRFALDHPGRVLGLALVGAFTTLKGKPDLAAWYEAEIAPLADPVDPKLVRDFQESTLARPVDAAFLEMVVGESLKLPARVWRDVFFALLHDDFSAEAGRIRAPVQILWGDGDAYTDLTEQTALRRAIPGAGLTVLEGFGHAPHWEDPAAFARVLIPFLRTLAVPA